MYYDYFLLKDIPVWSIKHPFLDSWSIENFSSPFPEQIKVESNNWASLIISDSVDIGWLMALIAGLLKDSKFFPKYALHWKPFMQSIGAYPAYLPMFTSVHVHVHGKDQPTCHTRDNRFL